MHRSTSVNTAPTDPRFGVRLVERSVPGTIDVLGAIALSWVSVAVVLGVAAGVAGIFQPVVVFALAAPAALMMARPLWRASTGSRRVAIPDVLAVVLVVVWIAGNALHSGQHVFPGSDPGVYVGTGWWLSTSSSPLIETAPGLVDTTDGTFSMSGFWDESGTGSLSPQFPQGLPVVLAIAKALGGAGVFFIAPVAIGGGALFAVYLLARRVISPWWALLAVASLAVNLVFIHFSRDAYTEPLTMLLLFGGAWLLLMSFEQPGLAVTAGVVLGAALCVRIDSLLAMSVLPVVAIQIVLVDGRRSVAMRSLMRAIPGVVVGAAVGLVDLMLIDRPYLRAQSGRLLQVLAGIALLGVAAAAVVRWRGPVRALLVDNRQWLSRLAVGVLGALALYVFVVRPLGGVTRSSTGSNAFVGEVLGREGHDPDPTRTMAEISGRWLWWYLGPLLIAGVFGVLEAVRRTLRHPDPAGTVLVTLVVVTGAVYLWRPSIVPLQIWAMRRFLPVVIPGIAVLGVWWLATLVARSGLRWVRAVVTVLAALVALSPGLRTIPVIDTTEQAGGYSFLEGVCADLPSNAVLFAESSSESRVWGPALRVFCGVPVVVTSSPDRGELMLTARDRGFDVLWFGSECPLPGETIVSTAAELPLLEFTVTRPPAAMTTDFYGIKVVRPTSLECG